MDDIEQSPLQTAYATLITTREEHKTESNSLVVFYNIPFDSVVTDEEELEDMIEFYKDLISLFIDRRIIALVYTVDKDEIIKSVTSWIRKQLKGENTFAGYVVDQAVDTRIENQMNVVFLTFVFYDGQPVNIFARVLLKMPDQEHFAGTDHSQIIYSFD